MPFVMRLVTPSGVAFEGEVEAAVVPGTGGCFGVLARHAPMLSTVENGILKVSRGYSEEYFVVGDGVVEVTSEETTVLTSIVTRASDPTDAEFKLEELLRQLSGPIVS